MYVYVYAHAGGDDHFVLHFALIDDDDDALSFGIFIVSFLGFDL